MLWAIFEREAAFLGKHWTIVHQLYRISELDGVSVWGTMNDVRRHGSAVAYP